MIAAAPCAQTTGVESPTLTRNARAVVTRYALSAAGPVCISVAHFLAALLFLHNFTRTEFGLFSFLLVIVPFCLSLAGSMIGAPAAVAVRRGTMEASLLATYLKANLVVGAAAASGVCLLIRLSGAAWDFSVISGAYGGAMTLRWFARTLFYTRANAPRVLISDTLYSACLVGALGLLNGLGLLSPLGAVEILFGSCLLALLSFGRDYLRDQTEALLGGSLAGYACTWNELARWSALGVLLTELTANAHAYLVTFIAGPAAFAPLAIGTLLMRPVQLVLAAIPDQERPARARLLGSGNYAGARRSVNHFRMAAGAVWLLTATMAAGLLLWCPHLVLKKGYDPAQALVVLGLFAAIAAVRSYRTPESVLLEAAGQFRALARAGLWSSLVSLLVTFALLIVVGPVFSLVGILAGQVVVTLRVRATARSWIESRA